MAAVGEVAYRYLTPSTCAGGDAALATSGGPSAHPRFFAGPIGAARAAAQGMLAVARVARSRYETITRADREAMLDPIVTAGDGVLRFESFSGCCGVYARLDLAGDTLADAFCGAGTTNVDFNPPMRQALGQVTDRSPLSLEVGPDSVAVAAGDAGAVERKVPLPERWVRGLGEVQVDLAGMVRRHDLAAPAARRFLQSLPPKATTTVVWAVPAGDGLRLSSSGAGGVAVAGPHRLRAAVDIVGLVRGLRVYGPPVAGRTSSSAWEVVLDGASLWVVLSPDVYRGFSGEGRLLTSLALGVPGAEAAANGRQGFDPAAGRWFDRELPFGIRLERAHPRLRDARALVAGDAVSVDGDSARVESDDAVQRVRLDLDPPTCTCPWFGKHAGDRGPCKHVLAAQIVAAG